MGEKKGQTEKLKYNFNSACECQVLLENGRWHRVSPREFRSWHGSRRFVKYKDQEQIYEEYNAPVYYWNTNVVCKEPQGIGPQFIHNMPYPSKIRPNERHLLS